MPTDIKELFENSNYLELGYQASRLCFFRHGHLIKIFNESPTLLDAQNLPSFRPNLCHIPESTASIDKLAESLDLEPNRARTQVVGFTASLLADYCMRTGDSLKDLLLKLKRQGIHYLDGSDFIDCLSEKKSYQQSIWYETHQLAHTLGIKSIVTLYPHRKFNFKTLQEIGSRLDEIQRSTRGFLYINFLNRGPIKEQLQLIATMRILCQEIHDFKIRMDRRNLLSCPIKLDFGINVVSRAIASDQTSHCLSELEFERVIKRSHKKPVDFVSQKLNEQQAQAFDSMKLYRLKHSNHHDLAHLLDVVAKSPTPAIGSSVPQTQQPLEYFDAAVLDASTLERTPLAYPRHCIIDFTKPLPLTYHQFKEVLVRHRRASPQTKWSGMGLKGFWQFAQKQNLKISHLAGDLVDFGVTAFSSGELESEESITHSEVIFLHRTFQQKGMLTTAKIELAAPYNGTEAPFWEPFLQRLLALVTLDQETNLLEGIIVQKSQNSFISTQDYLKAVAITRIVAKNQKSIITPPHQLAQGVMQPKIQTQEEYRNMLCLLQSFGGTSLGLRSATLFDHLDVKGGGALGWPKTSSWLVAAKGN